MFIGYLLFLAQWCHKNSPTQPTPHSYSQTTANYATVTAAAAAVTNELEQHGTVWGCRPRTGSESTELLSGSSQTANRQFYGSLTTT